MVVAGGQIWSKKSKRKVMERCSKTALEQKSSKSKDVKVRTVLYESFVVEGPGFRGLRFAEVKRKSC